MNTAKIVLVEDQLIPAYDMKQQLEELGYTVTGVFTDAEDAIAFLEKNKSKNPFPDVIITDIALGGKMTGFELFRIVASKYDCEVIITSGLINMKVIDEALATRPAFFLSKPFDICFTHGFLQKAIYERGLQKEIIRLKEEIGKLKEQI